MCRWIVVSVLCCAGALVACGEDDDSTTATEKRSAGGYVFRLPNGWRDITKTANTGAIKYDRVVEAQAGPPMNVSVVRERLAGADDVDDLAESRAKQVERSTGAPVRRLPKRAIDGEPARGQAFDPPEALNTLGRSVQYIAVRNGDLYTITLMSPIEDAKAAFDTFEQLLDSWRWKE